jgi:hypothetical protein
MHDSDLYDNANGFTTDVFTAPGHPGFPQDSDLLENNNFYSNNFNPYLPACPPGVKPSPPQPGQSPSAPGGNCSDVAPTVPMPVGTGMWIAGGNHNVMRNNHFYDNWRRGAMLFAIPDQLVCGGAGVPPEQLAGCNPGALIPSTSYNNEYYGNSMGVEPGGAVKPNGLDFWWDEYTDNTGNCWHDNTGSAGTPASVTSDPAGAALPSNCATSLGTSNPLKETELLSCFVEFSQGGSLGCTWRVTPPHP